MVPDSDAEDADDGHSSAVQTAEESRFQPPKPAEISSKRPSASNVTAGNPTKKSYPARSDHSGASFVSRISPKQRVSEFPNEYLAVKPASYFAPVVERSWARRRAPSRNTSGVESKRSPGRTKRKRRVNRQRLSLTTSSGT